ncbi:hypothetical protein [Chamaesiphon sp. VAR_48_metabat_135_sub]|uniref:RES family NAD+ phosphorylase n=1 Tax=Chamaesiphon sp. VAR_48_metabat_135_sub TaxID=2964699 RepID=UPI00286B8FBE|nr:hypothetical protein [Chamaesiphon sp. VAR_48_metabat_135_sub]
MLVHSETTNIPLTCVSATIPDSIPILDITDLPANWQQVSAYSFLKVLLAIIPVEYNYLINPKHPDLQLQLDRVIEFQFDCRMWQRI